MVPPFRFSSEPHLVALVLMLHHGRGWVFHPRGLTATSSTLTKPSETVVAGSKVPSALPANTRDVCVALGLVCACSCEQETLSSRIPAKTWNLKHGLYKYLDISYMLEKWSLKVGTLGVPFWSHFGGTFLAKCFKNATFG